MSEDGQVPGSQASGQTVDSRESSIRGLEASSIEEPGRPNFQIPLPNGSSMTSRTAISVAVDPVALITTECITVTSAMRKHARWAHSSVSAILGVTSPLNPGTQDSRPSTPRDDNGTRKGLKSRSSLGYADGGDDEGLANRWGLRGKKGKSMQDNPLMAGFGRLRRELTGCKGN
jgi:golgi-specific brefeldin A-resistance guanine nucleotide exchange factor 1